MTIKDVFDMLEKHNQMANLFLNMEKRYLEITMYNHYNERFRSFKEFQDYVMEEFHTAPASALLKAEIKEHVYNWVLGINDDGEIIMTIATYPER